jgi:hypothetical protein
VEEGGHFACVLLLAGGGEICQIRDGGGGAYLQRGEALAAVALLHADVDVPALHGVRGCVNNLGIVAAVRKGE